MPTLSLSLTPTLNEPKADGGLRQWLLSSRHDGLFTMTPEFAFRLSHADERRRQREAHLDQVRVRVRGRGRGRGIGLGLRLRLGLGLG